MTNSVERSNFFSAEDFDAALLCQERYCCVQAAPDGVYEIPLVLYRRLRIDKVKRLERRALNDVLKALLWGVVFMLCCQIVRYFADFPTLPTVTSTISEGMLVLGWVALWNPYDRLLFAWSPEVRRRRLLERIASFPLVLRPLTGTAASRLAVRTPESGR